MITISEDCNAYVFITVQDLIKGQLGNGLYKIRCNVCHQIRYLEGKTLDKLVNNFYYKWVHI